MKECPNCGSILADFEPYCTNCGFDPDYEIGYWKKGGYSAKMNYYHGDHIKDPDPYILGKEADWALCIVAWIILAGLIVIFYLEPIMLDIWQYNQDTITFLFFVIGVIVAVYVLYKGIKKYTNKIKANKPQNNRQKDLKVMSSNRKQKNLNYVSENLNYVVCMECGYENPKNLSKCWHCGADLSKQKPIYSKKHVKTEPKTLIKSETVNKSINVNYKKKSCKYKRCPKCNSLINVEYGGRCNYCNYNIYSGNFKY